jgi:hypothetical protein
VRLARRDIGDEPPPDRLFRRRAQAAPFPHHSTPPTRAPTDQIQSTKAHQPHTASHVGLSGISHGERAAGRTASAEPGLQSFTRSQALPPNSTHKETHCGVAGRVTGGWTGEWTVSGRAAFTMTSNCQCDDAHYLSTRQTQQMPSSTRETSTPISESGGRGVSVRPGNRMNTNSRTHYTTGSPRAPLLHSPRLPILSPALNSTVWYHSKFQSYCD